jgi:hypothetical protein
VHLLEEFGFFLKKNTGDLPIRRLGEICLISKKLKKKKSFNHPSILLTIL